MIEVVAIQNRFSMSKSTEDKELFNLHKHSLIHQGQLKLQFGRKFKKLTFFLFNDIAVIAKEKGQSLIRKHLFALNLCLAEFVTTSKHGKYCFNVTYSTKQSKKVKLLFSCNTAEERDFWVNKIIDQQKKCTN